MKASLWLTSLALLSCGAVECAAQSGAAHGGAWTLTLENDTFTGSDNNYTNGIGLSWVSNAIDTYDARSFVRRWGDSWSFLPFVGNGGYRTYVAWSLVQEMHTPDDIRRRTRPRTINPMPACCTWTASSMRKVNVPPMRGSSESAPWVHRRKLTTSRKGSTN